MTNIHLGFIVNINLKHVIFIKLVVYKLFTDDTQFYKHLNGKTNTYNRDPYLDLGGETFVGTLILDSTLTQNRI